MNAITSSLAAIWTSSIGKKIIVALTGLFLVLFLAGHLVGNLLIFAGPELFNDYAYFLHHMIHGMGIWLFRAVMVVMLGAHIAATVSLTLQNRAARQPYECKAVIQASTASRTMILSGLTILVFFIYHILHFTARIGNEYDTLDRYKETVMANGEPLVRHNAWLMVVDGFGVWYVSLFYVLAMTLLCLHLSHGFASIFQTLGLRPKKSESAIKHLSLAYSAVIWLGFISIPLAIWIFGFGS
jgi:succinate dehydrogenase / fumarate reductase cytochrome b subunit